MDLKRFSLAKEKEMKSNTITTHNKEPIKNKKIFSHTLEPPTLRLDTDYGATLYLKLCKDLNKALYFEANLRYSETSGCPKKDHFGYSANIFPALKNELKVMSNILYDDILRFYHTLIILGRIYEAACKSGFSMDDVEFDRDMLNSFVNKSLEFYRYNDYLFNCYLAIRTFSVDNQSYFDFFFADVFEKGKKFTISENEYILGYNNYHVYLQFNKDIVITLSSSYANIIMDIFKETSSSIKEALAWILLASKGFYVHNQKFVNSSLGLDNVIENSEFENKQEITPDNFAQCFKQS